MVLQVLAPPVLNSYLCSLGGRPGRPRPRPGEQVGACGCCWWRRVRVGVSPGRHVKTGLRGSAPVGSWVDLIVGGQVEYVWVRSFWWWGVAAVAVPYAASPCLSLPFPAFESGGNFSPHPCAGFKVDDKTQCRFGDSNVVNPGLSLEDGVRSCPKAPPILKDARAHLTVRTIQATAVNPAPVGFPSHSGPARRNSRIHYPRPHRLVMLDGYGTTRGCLLCFFLFLFLTPPPRNIFEVMRLE